MSIPAPSWVDEPIAGQILDQRPQKLKDALGEKQMVPQAADDKIKDQVMAR